MIEIVVAVVFSLLFIFAATVIFGAPFIPSFPRAVESIVSLSNAKKGERVVDLGSGDGRILIAFAKKGIEAHGYEINPVLVVWSILAIRRAGLSKLAYVHFRSFWGVGLSRYDVVVVYGVSGIMRRLEKKVKSECKLGVRVLSAIFDFPQWKSEKEENGIYFFRLKDRC